MIWLAALIAAAMVHPGRGRVVIRLQEKKSSQKGVTVNDTAGALSFESMGKVTMTSSESVLVIRLDVTKIIQAVSDQADAITKMFDYQDKEKENASIIPQWWSHRITDFRQEGMVLVDSLQSDATLLRDHARRTERDFGNWILGLFNFFTSQDLRGHLGRNDQATRLVGHGVDINAHNVDTTDENLKSLLVSHEGLDEQVQFMFKYDDIVVNWRRMERHVDQVRAVMHGAMAHRLDPAVANLVPLQDEWESFVQKLADENLKPAFRDYRHLFSAKADMFFKRGELVVAVRIPATGDKKREMDFFKWIGGPILVNGSLMEVEADAAYLALDSEGWFSEMTEAEQEDCFPGDQRVCPGGSIMYRNGESSCLYAIYQSKWEAAALVCKTVPSQGAVKAWSRGEEFLTYSRDELWASVDCQGNAEKPVRLQGLQRVHIPDGCKVSSGEMILAQSKALGQGITLTVHLEAENASRWEIQRERPVYRSLVETNEVSREVAALIEEGDDNTLLYVAIAAVVAAVLAMGVVVTFVGFVCKRVNLGAVVAQVATDAIGASQNGAGPAAGHGGEEDGREG